MKKKILEFILCCIVLMAIGLFFIIKPTKTSQVNQTANVNLETIISPEPTVEPTPEPTVEPTPEPTVEPTVEPSEEPMPIVEDEEPAEVKALVDEANGVSDSIIDVTPEATPTPEALEETDEAEVTPTPESAQPTPSPEVEQEEAQPTPSAEPQPTATPNPNVDTKPNSDKQSEAAAEFLRRLAEQGGNQDIPNDPNLTYGGNGGNGTKYGDLQ